MLFYINAENLSKHKENYMFIQQGDVCFKRIDNLPEGLTKVQRRVVGKPEERYIIAEGEYTGHAHAIVDEVDLMTNGTTMYLKNDYNVKVDHEEHKAITNLPPGIWEIGIVQEYDHFAEEAKKVAD